jgi:outer membrane transport energization protein ExbD (TC 2.C.1.1.1)
MMGSGGFGGDNHHTQPMAEINTTPMVDVMLVLLVIFIITAPLLTHSIKIDLPQAGSQSNPEKPDIVTLSINGEGKLFWNDAPFEEAELASRLGTEAQKKPQPEVHLRAINNKLSAIGNGYVRCTKRRNRKTWICYRAEFKKITQPVYAAVRRSRIFSQPSP